MKRIALTDGMSDSEYLEILETKTKIDKVELIKARINKMGEPFYTRAMQVLSGWERGNDTASTVSYQNRNSPILDGDT